MPVPSVYDTTCRTCCGVRRVRKAAERRCRGGDLFRKGASMGLEGKAAIVTGGGQGLGRAVALVLSQRGARVAIMGRTSATLDAVVDEIERAGGHAVAVVGDVGSRADVQR